MNQSTAPSSSRAFRRALDLVVVATFTVCGVLSASGGRLPVRRYTIADGLPSDHIVRVVVGSRGYLWVGSGEGLSRFDGSTFLTFGRKEGLPSSGVRDVLETMDGQLWVATSRGLCRFGPARNAWESGVQLAGDPGVDAGDSGGDLFQCLELGPGGERITADVLFEDDAGTLWVGASGGLFRITESGDRAGVRPVPLDLEPPEGAGLELRDITECGDGTLWVGTQWGLARRPPGGTFSRFELVPPGRIPGVNSLLCDSQGRLWIGTHAGVYLVPFPVAAGQAGEKTTRPGPPSAPGPHAGPMLIGTGRLGPVFDLHEDPGGTIWLAGSSGLCSIVGGRLTCYDDPQVLSRPISGITADSTGDLWLASEGQGLLRLAGSSMVSFGREDGLAETRINAIFESQRGDLCATSKGSVARFDGVRFISAQPRLPENIHELSWGWNQMTVQDTRGRWWFPTAGGLARFPASPVIEAMGRRMPGRVFTTGDGLATDDVFRLLLDSRGDIWIVTISAGVAGLSRWNHVTDTIERIGLPPRVERTAATAMAEDHRGNLWLGFYDGGLLRRDGSGGDLLVVDGGGSGGFVEDLYIDRRGRLWEATAEGGVYRFDLLDTAAPRLDARYTVRDGIASDRVYCIAEDYAGRIYLGTGQGVDRLDAETGRIEHFDTGDGLPNNQVVVAYEDRHGLLWFGTLDGIARLDPRVPQSHVAPPVFIDRLRVGGVPRKISPRGLSILTGLRLPAVASQLEIGFTGVGLGISGLLRYRHRLIGVDDRWTEPTGNASVFLGGLPPGRYRFEVEALSGTGARSPVPAAVAFTVIPPIWGRWWFVLLVATGLLLAAAGIYRLWAARLVAVERVRTEIATDLHDELGTALTRISILSAVAERGLSTPHQGAAGPAESADSILRAIGATARRLLDANRELVWSLDSELDDLHSLITRLRRFAGDTLGGTGIVWELATSLSPREARAIHLQPEIRRGLFLLLKEAITNIATHSQADTVSIRIERERGILVTVVDDGCGFDLETGEAAGGHGLGNMRARAAQLGGDLLIETSPGKGTRIQVKFPGGEGWWRKA